MVSSLGMILEFMRLINGVGVFVAQILPVPCTPFVSWPRCFDLFILKTFQHKYFLTAKTLFSQIEFIYLKHLYANFSSK